MQFFSHAVWNLRPCLSRRGENMGSIHSCLEEFSNCLVMEFSQEELHVWHTLVPDPMSVLVHLLHGPGGIHAQDVGVNGRHHERNIPIPIQKRCPWSQRIQGWMVLKIPWAGVQYGEECGDIAEVLRLSTIHQKINTFNKSHRTNEHRNQRKNQDHWFSPIRGELHEDHISECGRDKW